MPTFAHTLKFCQNTWTVKTQILKRYIVCSIEQAPYRLRQESRHSPSDASDKPETLSKLKYVLSPVPVICVLPIWVEDTWCQRTSDYEDCLFWIVMPYSVVEIYLLLWTGSKYHAINVSVYGAIFWKNPTGKFFFLALVSQCKVASEF